MKRAWKPTASPVTPLTDDDGVCEMLDVGGYVDVGHRVVQCLANDVLGHPILYAPVWGDSGLQ